MINLLEKLHALADECGLEMADVFERFATWLRKECGIETDPAKANGWSTEGEAVAESSAPPEAPVSEPESKVEAPAAEETASEAEPVAEEEAKVEAVTEAVAE